MIVKQSRSSKGRAAKLTPHLLEGAENEEIHELHGDVEDIVALSESRVAGTSLKHEMRQVIFSPDRHLTPEQEARMVALWQQEFGAEGFEFALVKHVKRRANGSDVGHYHLVTPERDRDGRALDKAHFKVRNEKIARILEIEFGHELTKGTHNRAVYEHLKQNGREAEAAMIEQLTAGRPALSRFSAKAHQVAKRLGIDLPRIAEELRPGKGESAGFHAEQMSKLLADHPNIRIGLSDQGHMSLLAENGTFIASLNRVAKINIAMNDEIMAMINAAEMPSTHLPDEREIDHVRADATARTTTSDGAAEAAEQGFAGPRVDQRRHDNDTAKARRAGESRSVDAISDARNSGIAAVADGADSVEQRSYQRDARYDQRSNRSAESRAERDRISHKADAQSPSHQRKLTKIEVAQLNQAWALHRDAIAQLKTPDFRKPLAKVDTRLVDHIEPLKPSLPAVDRLLSKLQQSQLRRSWTARRDAMIGSKFGAKSHPELAKVDLRKAVNTVKPALPPVDVLLSKLQQIELQTAWQTKRNKLIKAAAFAKPRTELDKSDLRPSSQIEVLKPAAPLPPSKPLAQLSTAELRKLFARVKGLSGNLQKQAVAKLLREHGLRLAEGSKSGVITINRRLDNGAVELVGSLERFAGIQSNDRNRSLIMRQIASFNVREAKPDHIHQENDGGQHAATEEQRRDQARRHDLKDPLGDQKPALGDAESEPGRRVNGIQDASSVRASDRQDRQHRSTDTRLSQHADRTRDGDEHDAARAVNDLPPELSHRHVLGEEIGALKAAISGIVERYQHRMHSEIRADGWLLMTSKTDIKPMPDVDKAPAGQAKPRRPSVGGGGHNMEQSSKLPSVGRVISVADMDAGEFLKAAAAEAEANRYRGP